MSSEQDQEEPEFILPTVLPTGIHIHQPVPVELKEIVNGGELPENDDQQYEVLGSFGYLSGDSTAAGQTITDVQVEEDESEETPSQLETTEDQLSKEVETELTNKFLNGELTFSEYAALMEEGKPDDGSAETRQAAAAAFEEELQAASSFRGKRYRGNLESGVRKKSRRVLPPALVGLMGEARLRYSRGERENAAKMCLEIIRQVPTAPEPFQMLAALYEELGDPEKSLQFALIAAHLSPHDEEQWIRLAVMSETQGNLKQAVTCYTKAITANPTNIQNHMKRCSLLETIGDRKLELKCYMRLLGILTSEQAPLVLQVAKMTAHKYHEDGELTKAKEAMEVAFEKCSDLITSEDVNLMLELLLTLKLYSQCLEVLVQYCGVDIEAEAGDSIEGVSSLKVLSYGIPESLPVDLQTKLTVVLIHLKAFHLLDKLLMSLLHDQDPEESGDLYLDVAEALMQEKRHEDALRLLIPLVDSENFSLPAVWLRQAECLHACGRLEEAATAYEMVVIQAPQHLEARVTLSGLLNRLGHGEEALAVLTQDAESEVLDPGLLYERCMLLKEVPGRTDEYLAVGQLLLSRHCVKIRNRDELHALTRMRRLDRKSEALKEIRTSRGEPHFDTDAPDFGDGGRNAPSVDEEYQLLHDMCKTCLRVGRTSLLQRLSFSALGSHRFYSNPQRIHELEFLCLLASFYNGDAYYGYNLARDQLLREKGFPRIWNFFNLVIQRSDDARHNRFLMRLLARHPSHEALAQLHANNCLVAGTYKYALSEYAASYRSKPGPLLAFLLGVTLFQMACQKFSAKKHALVTQGISFLWKYQQFRGKEGAQETSYNLGRAFHQLGLLPPAIYHYKQALEFSSPLIDQYPHILDLKREAAFNLYLIYQSSGARDIARSYIEKYIVV